MSGLEDLYQEVILDHSRRPRNSGALPDAGASAEGYNPLCGDRVRVHLTTDGDRIEEIRFEGVGCAISTASASLMTEVVKGKRVAEALDLHQRFHELLTGDPSVREVAGPELGKLAVFSGVREFPVRVKCATLPWHTLKQALAEGRGSVSTE
ncbi:MAG: SUF system NifU family Fe-S cluster assembly protein [Thermoanaerobaculia bacterium]|nr:SUF system NifU family Fe-S cluster assembly protein [Thermoanaerobaculia bacterium]